MAGPLLDFRWYVPMDGQPMCGHRWESGFGYSQTSPPSRRPWEIPISLLHDSTVKSKKSLAHPFLKEMGGLEPREYSPLKDVNGLFRTFAETEPTPEGVLKFADQYGSLGGDVVNRFRPEAASPDSIPDFGEPLIVWIWEIKSIRHSVAIWDLIRNGAAEELSKVICWNDSWDEGFTVSIRFLNEEDQPPFLIEADDESTAQIPRIHGSFEEAYRSGDPFLPALNYVQGVINTHLRKRTQSTLQGTGNIASPFDLQIKPDSLIGAIWLQFALALDGNYDYHPCEECSLWFAISPGAGRPEKQYCSDACRMRAYRKRKSASRAT